MNELAEYRDDMFIEEKINGKIYLMARPLFNHMRVQRNLCGIFEEYFRKTGKDCEAIFETQLDIHNKYNDYVVPDVMVLCYNQDDDVQIPLIVVEVLSKSTRSKDLSEKMELYAKLGIKEYWIADLKNLSVDIYILNEENNYKLYKSYVYYEEEDFPKNKRQKEEEEKKFIKEFSPVLFPELIIKLEDIFYRVIKIKI